MLVVVQRAWPLLGKVLVQLSRNRSVQSWDSPWTHRVTERTPAKAHCSMMWKERGVKMGRFNLTISTVTNILEPLRTASIASKNYETAVQPIQVLHHKLLKMYSFLQYFKETLVTPEFKDFHTTVLTVHFKKGLNGQSMRNKAWMMRGKDGWFCWVFCATFQEQQQMSTQKCRSYLHAGAADRYEAHLKSRCFCHSKELW